MEERACVADDAITLFHYLLFFLACILMASLVCLVQIIYEDEVEENLNLSKERWELVAKCPQLVRYIFDCTQSHNQNFGDFIVYFLYLSFCHISFVM